MGKRGGGLVSFHSIAPKELVKESGPLRDLNSFSRPFPSFFSLSLKNVRMQHSLSPMKPVRCKYFIKRGGKSNFVRRKKGNAKNHHQNATNQSFKPFFSRGGEGLFLFSLGEKVGLLLRS